MQKHLPDATELLAFLRARHPSAAGIEPLHGGDWSSAFAFHTGDGRRLVIRLGQHPDDYAKDRLAATWSRTRLPVPVFLEQGQALGAHYAITAFVPGTKLNELPATRMRRAITNLFATLEAMRTIAPPGAGYGLWNGPSGDAPHARWRDVLTAVAARDDARLAGWREALRQHPEPQRIFDAAQRAVERLAPSCPDLRCVIHDDLLYGNVLVNDDDGIAAVLDWGTSMMGDPIHDLAMLLFWLPWYPAIDGAQVQALAHAAFPVADFEQRVAACQLHIALSAMQYQAKAGYLADLEATAAHTARLLRRLH